MHSKSDDKPPRRPRARTVQRLARRMRVQRLISAMYEGATVGGMAESEGISPRRVNELLDYLGFPKIRRARHRIVISHVRDVDLETLDELASDAGVSRSEIMTRLAVSVLSNGKRSAARALGKLAR